MKPKSLTDIYYQCPSKKKKKLISQELISEHLRAFSGKGVLIIKKQTLWCQLVSNKHNH